MIDRSPAPTTQPSSYAQLLSLAVHELRTPASVVGGYLRMVLRDAEAPLGDRHRKMLEEAEKSCARLVALIGELSDVSKLDSNAVPFEQRTFDLFSAVGDAAGGVEEGRDRDILVHVRGESAGGSMVGDETRIRSAVSAIVRGVCREQPAACTVVVDRQREPRKDGLAAAVIAIGPERVIASLDRDNLGAFDEKRGGMGLALPIARRIIEGHGGRLVSPLGDAARGAAIISLPLAELNR